MSSMDLGNLLLFMEEIELSYPSDLSIECPCTLFRTINPFGDYYADDMQCGDMNEQQLRSLGLNDISGLVDPYRLICYDFPSVPIIYGEYSSPPGGRKISHQECVNILFNEMIDLSNDFARIGEYKNIIKDMISHFRYGNGESFYSQSLNSAFENRVNEPDPKSPISIIKSTIEEDSGPNSYWNAYMPLEDRLDFELHRSMLPKFNQVKDRINGLGIAVHDIHAQKITLLSIEKYAIGWEAEVLFEAQDHFGLDCTDIKSELYSQFRFFRIWFFLQRHRDYAFRPFLTNFSALARVGSYK